MFNLPGSLSISEINASPFLKYSTSIAPKPFFTILPCARPPEDRIKGHAFVSATKRTWFDTMECFSRLQPGAVLLLSSQVARFVYLEGRVSSAINKCIFSFAQPAPVLGPSSVPS